MYRLQALPEWFPRVHTGSAERTSFEPVQRFLENSWTSLSLVPLQTITYSEHGRSRTVRSYSSATSSIIRPQPVRSSLQIARLRSTQRLCALALPESRCDRPQYKGNPRIFVHPLSLILQSVLEIRSPQAPINRRAIQIPAQRGALVARSNVRFSTVAITSAPGLDQKWTLS